MQLTEQQQALVRAWAAEGASLSDIQTRLADECGVKLSYLDTRFLLIDLKVDLTEKPEKKPAPDPLASGAPAGDPAGGRFGPADGGPDPYDPTSGSPADYDEPPEPSDLDAPAGQDGQSDQDAPAAPVSVELDRIQRPGFAASGTLTCSDGVKGQWGVDDYGRLALAFPDNKGYRPSAADQQEFMLQLRNLLSGGY